MFVPFLLGFAYFAIKAYTVKENIWLYGIVCGIGTGIATYILIFLCKAVVLGPGTRLDETSALVIGLILTALAIMVVERWSGLYWDVEKHKAAKERSQAAEQEITADEMAKFRNLQTLHATDSNAQEDEEIYTAPSKKPPTLDDITDLDSFLALDVKEEKEPRAYDDFPEAENFYSLARDNQHHAVITMGLKLLEKYQDFHSVYRRTARSYRIIGEVVKSDEIYLLGLKRSKNKSGICANLAEHCFEDGDYLLAVKWWAKAGGLQLYSGNMRDHNPFLYMAYFAEYLNLPDENSKLLSIVDSIQEYIRFNETGATEIFRASKGQWGKEIKAVIQRFCSEYLE